MDDWLADKDVAVCDRIGLAKSFPANEKALDVVAAERTIARMEEPTKSSFIFIFNNRTALLLTRFLRRKSEINKNGGVLVSIANTRMMREGGDRGDAVDEIIEMCKNATFLPPTKIFDRSMKLHHRCSACMQ